MSPVVLDLTTILNVVDYQLIFEKIVVVGRLIRVIRKNNFLVGLLLCRLYRTWNHIHGLTLVLVTSIIILSRVRFWHKQPEVLVLLDIILFVI
jgi:hypothetical protein